MEKFEVKILGCGSALPTARHNTAAQLVNIHEKLFLVDCGRRHTKAIMESRGKDFQSQPYIYQPHARRPLFRIATIAVVDWLNGRS